MNYAPSWFYLRDEEFEFCAAITMLDWRTKPNKYPPFPLMYRVTPSANYAISVQAKRKASHYIQYIYIYIYVFPVCDATAQCRPWLPLSGGFWITHDMPQTAGFFWTSDQLVARTSARQHTTLKTHKHPYHRRDSKLNRRAAAALRPRPRCHGDQILHYL